LSGCASSQVPRNGPEILLPNNYRAVIALPRETNSERTITISVRGQVKEPGEYEVPEGTTILQAIETAGGFTDYAFTRKLDVIESGGRHLGLQRQIRKSFRSVPLLWYGPSTKAEDFVLTDGASVHVPLCCF
jgi:hypothetical protein